MTNEAEERARYIENLKSLGHRNIPISQNGLFLDMYQRFRWEGWQAARAASPVSAPILRKFRVALQRIADNPDGIDCECQHDDKNCCEVEGEFCPTCIAACVLAEELAAAPSVASEDSATQPVTLAEAINLGRESWQAKHGKCSMCALGDVPVDGLHRGKHKCGNEAGSAFIPGSEDWMRKAAEEYLRQAHPDLMADMVDELSSIIAKHYAASQLSTEKK